MRPLLALVLALLAVLPARADVPPKEHGIFRPPDLVEVIRLDPTLRLDLRYATADNFMGRVLYPDARCFLQRPAALALAAANAEFREMGCRLVVLDGYRPWSVTRQMWEAAPPEWREGGYVADPERGSRHNRGCTVDVTLQDLDTGRFLDMPSAYDSFEEKAHADYPGGTDEQRRNRDLLIRVMGKHGFKVLPQEWWHFDHRDWEEYELLDLPFNEISSSGGTPP